MGAKSAFTRTVDNAFDMLTASVRRKDAKGTRNSNLTLLGGI